MVPFSGACTATILQMDLCPSRPSVVTTDRVDLHQGIRACRSRHPRWPPGDNPLADGTRTRATVPKRKSGGGSHLHLRWGCLDLGRHERGHRSSVGHGRDFGAELTRSVAQKLVLYHLSAGGQFQHCELLKMDAKPDRTQSALDRKRCSLRTLTTRRCSVSKTDAGMEMPICGMRTLTASEAPLRFHVLVENFAGEWRGMVDNSEHWREIDPRERALLMHLLRDEFQGRAEILQQMNSIEVMRVSPEGSLRLRTSGPVADVKDNDAPSSRANDKIPIEGFYDDEADDKKAY